MHNERRVAEVLRGGEPHWVGDGFPVHSLFSVQSLGERLSPFLLLDYAPPTEFPPTHRPRGVESHPHRGFETVTIVYQGALEHRDSTGSHGSIGPGDVQWMTAASGILHEEKHERNWSRQGGVLQMAQLWVNLPARDKAAPPAYQTLLRDRIPVVDLPQEAGSVRVIAGEFAGMPGAASTFTPINVYDARLRSGGSLTLQLPPGHNAAVIVLEGEARLNESDLAPAGSVAILAAEGEQTRVEATPDTTLLILSGEPIREPTVAYGPFVMNTEAEIRQALDDYRSGRMGTLEPA